MKEKLSFDLSMLPSPLAASMDIMNEYFEDSHA